MPSPPSPPSPPVTPLETIDSLTRANADLTAQLAVANGKLVIAQQQATELAQLKLQMASALGYIGKCQACLGGDDKDKQLRKISLQAQLDAL